MKGLSVETIAMDGNYFEGSANSLHFNENNVWLFINTREHCKTQMTRKWSVWWYCRNNSY
jgi:hypothetical protein